MTRVSQMNDATYMKTYRATKNDIKNNNAKYCTNETCISHEHDAQLTHDAFARDRAQRDELCVWCRRCEMIYNRARDNALRACNVRTRREINDIVDDALRNEMHELYDTMMRDANVRSRRYTRRNNV